MKKETFTANDYEMLIGASRKVLVAERRQAYEQGNREKYLSIDGILADRARIALHHVRHFGNF